jgi:hypothetical protein
MNILESFEEFLQTEKLNFQKVDDGRMLQMHISGDNGSYKMLAGEIPKRNIFIVYTTCPVFISENKTTDISEFVNRANSCRLLGKFEFNVDEGEISHSVAIDFSYITAFEKKIFKTSLAISLKAMDDYLPGLLNVLYANKSPKEVIDEIENGKEKTKKLKLLGGINVN